MIKKTKGQSLPLNTVVIAILVILVLAIVIFFFTRGMNSSNSDLDRNTQAVNACEVGSYLISEDNYMGAEQVSLTTGQTCNNYYGASSGYEKILTAKITKEGMNACCAHKKTTTSDSSGNPYAVSTSNPIH